jgi:hypothetical protein
MGVIVGMWRVRLLKRRCFERFLLTLDGSLHLCDALLLRGEVHVHAERHKAVRGGKGCSTNLLLSL